MGRRRRLYKNHLAVWKGQRSRSKVLPLASSSIRLPAARTNDKTLLTSAATKMNTSAFTYASAEIRKRKLKSLKNTLIRVEMLNTGLSGVAAISGYLALWFAQDGDTKMEVTVVTGVLLLLSFVQAALIVSYWSVNVKYFEIMGYSLGFQGEQGSRSLHSLIFCFFECCLHLIAPLPNANFAWEITIFGKKSVLSLNIVFYFAVIARNYHIVRVLYWRSAFSDCRTHIFSNLAGVSSYKSFVLRSCLAAYSLKFVGGIMGVMVLIPGIIKYAVEHSALTSQVNLWDDFWVVTYTQLTIGYGEHPPDAFLCQAIVVTSCLLGIFVLGLFNAVSSETLVLNLTECNLYSELLYTKYKRRYSPAATVLLQRWWRLMLMRKQGLILANVIVPYYSYLRTYRGTLVKCQRIKDTRFERQADAFEKSTLKKIRNLNEYLRPVSFAFSNVKPI